MRYRVVVPAQSTHEIPRGAALLEEGRSRHGLVFVGREHFGELCANAARQGRRVAIPAGCIEVGYYDATDGELCAHNRGVAALEQWLSHRIYRNDLEARDNRNNRRQRARRLFMQGHYIEAARIDPAWACKRKLAMIYFNTDASYRDGWAGIAYDTNGLGSHRQLVPCLSSSEAELFAVLLAMEVAEKARLTSVVFRTDCEATAQPDRGGSRRLRPLRGRVSGYLAQYRPGWRLELVSRHENVLANRLARDALRALSDLTVTVTVNSTVAAALIERAGIPVTEDGQWRLSDSEDSTCLNAALCSALVLLAAGARHGAADRPRAIWRG